MFPIKYFDIFDLLDSISPMKAQMDAWDDGTNVNIALAIPGYDKGQISVIAEDGLLTVTAKKDDNDSKDYLVKTSSSEYMQRVVLPSGLDTEKADASYENGVLKVAIPKIGKKSPLKIK